jgi:general secretion pathway protein L
VAAQTASLRDGWDGLRQGLRDFVEWWLQQMRSFVPQALRPGEADDDALILAYDPAIHDDPPRLELIRRRRRAEEDLGSVVLDNHAGTTVQKLLTRRSRPKRIVLRLPAQTILERQVHLPLAAERELERVLAYEMDRLTPFSAAELFWTYAVEERDRARGSLTVRLSLVPKRTLQTLIDRLAQTGLHPWVLEIPVAAGATRLVQLTRDPSAINGWQRRGLAFMAALCAILTVAVAALPFVLQASARSRVEDQIARLRPTVSKAEALRSRIARNASSADVITNEQTRLGDTLEVLATVTDLLPDDTYLTELSLRERKLEINGESAGAARLIAILSADPSIRNPVFAAPVTHLGTGTKDVFAIRAEIGH